jgi:hypothetical protein
LPVLNAAGELAFSARISGTGVTASNNQGIWLVTRDELELIVRTGDPATGTDLDYGELSQPALSDSGRIAFRSMLPDSNVDPLASGIWTKPRHQPVEPVAFAGQPVPNRGANAIFLGFATPQITSQGDIALFDVELVNGTRLTSIRIKSEGRPLSLVTQNGAPAIGLAVNEKIVIHLDFQVNDAAQVAVWSTIRRPNASSFINIGAISFVSPGDPLFVIARGERTAPEIEEGATYGVFRDHVINQTGDVAFVADVHGQDIEPDNDSGLWLKRPDDALRLVAREGSTIPGLDGVFFGNLPHASLPSLVMSADRIVFSTQLVGPKVEAPTQALFSYDFEGGFQIVAKEGDPAPGLSMQAEFASVDKIALNAPGQLAFQASFVAMDGRSFGGQGIWAEDRNGELQLIARTGQMLDVDKGPGTNLRSIVGLAFASDAQAGKRGGFSDRGQLAFWTFLDDGSEALFISDAVAVPEPSPFFLTAGMAAWVARCFRRLA